MTDLNKSQFEKSFYSLAEIKEIKFDPIYLNNKKLIEINK